MLRRISLWLHFKAEEPPTALLLGHAAFLSARKGAHRRAALWYLRAADRLEKAGIVSISKHNNLENKSGVCSSN